MDNSVASIASRLVIKLDKANKALDALREDLCQLAHITADESLLGDTDSYLMAAIEGQQGLFSADLVTCEDIRSELENNHPGYENLSSSTIGKTLSRLGRYVRKRGQKRGTSARIWVLRDHDEYLSLTCTELYTLYEKQMEALQVPGVTFF